MQNINQAYINGKFVTVQGNETIDITNPATEESIGSATLANRADARAAIEAAIAAQRSLGRTTKIERIAMLRALQSAVLAKTEQLRDCTIEEYGAPFARAEWISQYAAQCFANTVDALERCELVRQVGESTVRMEPVGVAGLIAPWNATVGTVCSKLASAIAAGCASVIKPPELSPIQTHVLAEALHEAALPPGVFNIVIGRGTDVGDEITSHPHVAKISFTGSTPTGQHIARAGIATMKRVSLALSGKSATIILDDADLSVAVPLAVNAAFLNNGQACVAGSRLLIPRARRNDIIARIQSLVAAIQVGDPRDPKTAIGPLFNRPQFDRVQSFIARGQEQGAITVAGGPGRPNSLTKGFYVRPTVFADVTNDMDIAQQEIFGPVLSVINYESDDEAVAIANDSVYGLQGYVFSSQPERARRIASQMQAGTVLINRINPDLLAPFGGVKQSGVGREFGIFGLESYLEPKTIAEA